MVSRGAKAYAECRRDAADIYLGAALDIAMLRAECPRNGVFSDVHLIRPAEYMIRMLLSSEEYARARQLLAKLNALCEQSRSKASEHIRGFLHRQYKSLGDAGLG